MIFNRDLAVAKKIKLTKAPQEAQVFENYFDAENYAANLLIIWVGITFSESLAILGDT